MRPIKGHSAFSVRGAVKRASPDDGKQAPSRFYSVCSGGRSSFQGIAGSPFRSRKPSETQTRHCVGLMMPIYLAPLIIYGTRSSLCLYSVLLPLFWWLTSSVPHCVAAFAPVVTLPALQIMSADETATYFFESKCIEITALLAFLTAVHTTGSLVPRISFKICSRFGLQVRPLFVGVACVSYVLALFLHQGVVALLFVMAVEKVLSCVHESELDRTLIDHYEEPDNRDWLSLPLILSGSATPGVEVAQTDKLFDQLAKAVVNLKEEDESLRVGQQRGSVVELQKELWEIEATPAIRRKETSPSRKSAQRHASRFSRGSIAGKLASVRTSISAILGARRRSSALGGSQKQPPTNRSTASESASPRDQDKDTTSPHQDPGVVSSPTSIESPQRHISIAERCASPSVKISVTAPASPVLSLAGQGSTVGKQTKRDGEKRKPNAGPSKLTKTTGLSSPATCMKVAMKDPGVTSPKKHVGKRRPKRSTSPTSKSSSKTKLLAGNSDAATNKNTCRSPGQAKGTPDGVGAEIGKVAAVASPKIQSPVAKRKDKRTRIDTAEIAVVNVTPGYPSPEMHADAQVQQDGASGSGPLSSTSSPASPVDGQPDIRRPSILKVPGTASKARVMALLSSGSSYRPDDFMRRPSTVDFGPPECRMLPASSECSDVKPESPEPPSPLRAGAPVGDVPSSPKRVEPSIPTSVADSRALRVSSPSEERGFGLGRRISLSNTNSLLAPGSARRPAPPSAGNKGNNTVAGNIQATEDKNAIRRKNASYSMRTAFVLCSSLVTVTSSLCSTITIASRHALFAHRIVNPGPHGFLIWLVLSTPTALLSTVCCCLLLYLQHLRSSDVIQSAKDHRNVCIAAGKKLRKLGPVSGHDFLLVYAFILYLLFMLMAPIFHYNIRDDLVVFGSSILIMTSAMPWSASQYWNPEHRMVCWSAVARDLPWPVVIVQSAVLLIARTVERNNLVETGFATVGADFWASNSRLTNQMLFGAVGSVLAEMDDNESLGPVLMPIVLDIARETRVAPVLYAVPVALSASSNMILPIRIPLIVAHEVIDVPMAQLALIGVVVKTVVVFTSILSVNTFGRYLISLEPLDTNATIYSNDTYLTFGA